MSILKTPLWFNGRSAGLGGSVVSPRDETKRIRDTLHDPLPASDTLRRNATLEIERSSMPTTRLWFPSVVVLLLNVACSGIDRPPATDAAPAADTDLRERMEEPIALIPSALGEYSWPITTDVPKAQEYFDQGMQLRWGFNVPESTRSMVEARRADPDCAMCWWGEAFTLGSFLNGKMNESKAELAREAILKAQSLMSGATPVEKAVIEASLVRYPEDFDPKERETSDRAFADAMAKVYEEFPEHDDVGTIYGVALFQLEERRGYRDLDDPDLIRLHGVLTSVLDRDVRHPGACHLYIHATESSQDPGLALDCAEHLGDTMPVASHIQHMPSHTWNEVGLWAQSVIANTRAWHADQKAKEGKGFSYAPSHNLHMLLFAASMDGQGAVAMQAARDFARLGGNTMHQVLTLLRFGRFEEILEVTKRPTGEVAAGMWDFAQGYAQLRTGDADAAREYLAKVQSVAQEHADATFRFHKASQLMGLVGELLEGEILRADDDLDGAIAAFERAAEFDDAQDYDEPEPIPFAARHWLGAALLEAERYAEAERVYRTELEDHPHNVWSLHGLKQALAAQGKTDAAVDADFEESTARSDTWIKASRF